MMDYFSITLPTLEPTKEMKTPQKQHLTKQNNAAKIIPTPIVTTDKIVTLTELLANNLFYDALAYYLENSTDVHRKQIEAYLALLAKSDPLLTLEYMQVFLDNVPESTVWKLMISTHIAQGNFTKAIKLIIKAKENYVSEYEDKRLSLQLRTVATQYISLLLQRREYAKLIAFLEEMIAYDTSDSFYQFRLAQLYMKLDKTQEASALLDALKYDEVYAQNVKSLLNTIDKEEDETYQYAIPLEKYGEHYVVHVILDDNTFTLLLDTGATYILLDEEKASMLKVIRNDLLLQTVGNDVKAKLCKVNHLSMGNLQLPNIEVTLAPFKREGIDGLLGMNFFNRFHFYINQEEHILYLNPRQ